MAEILLIFPPDKEAAALQVETALASAGHRAVLEAVVEPDGEAIARKASGHAAALLIWSRPLAAAADLGGWLGTLRRLPNLIEVSTDGIAPQSGDERRVVLLSGWRGQPFHLGWQRLLEELEGLGARRSAPVRPELPPAPAQAQQPAPERPTPEAGAAPRRSRLWLPAAAALALAGAVAGAAWLGSNPSDPPRPTGRPAAAVQAPPASPAPPPSADAAIPPAADPARAPPASPQSPPALAPAPEPPPLALAGASPSAKAEPRPVAKAPRPAAKPRAAPAPPLKRYSRKYSKTMRQFCARSGRSTPQCRDFARSTRVRS